MKLTQQTLFQCFEKSHTKISSNIPSYQSSQTKTSSENPESSLPQTDFVVPIHIHQFESSSSLSNTNLSWKERLIHDENFSFSNQTFYRICPTIIHNQISLPKLQFTKISSIEHQLELFQQYIKEQSVIDWKSIFEGLQDYRNKAFEQNQYEQLLWTELYRPKTSKTYLGNHTKQIKRLNEWFAHWTTKLQNEQPKKLLPKKRKRLTDNETDDYTDDSNMSYASYHHTKPEHPQLIFIHGSGTTSLVHAFAEEYNFKITEINGTQSRARTPLLKQLEQVTSHHHLAFKRCPSDTLVSQGNQREEKIKSTMDSSSLSLPPAKKKAKNERSSITSYLNQSKIFIDEQKENQSRCQLKEQNLSSNIVLTNETNISKKRRSKIKQEKSIVNENQLLSSVHVEKTSLILFDEIETLTTDDNFWSCLKKLLETAKKPIILTSNSRTNPEEAIINLSKLGFYELIHLESNETELICSFLRLILLTEMFEISSFDDLISLYKYCSSDLRQTLSTLQFLVQSTDQNSSVPLTSLDKTHSELSKIQWQSAQIFDAIHYSYLNEQSNNSQLKILFNNLTEKYTSEYEQSHSLLMKASLNDTKRMELYDTFKLFMQEQEIVNILDHPSFYLDYRPYIRQICQNEQIRTKDINTNRRLRHSLGYRGCSLQWSDFEILSAGIE